jgi:dienelactone hydrolase
MMLEELLPALRTRQLHPVAVCAAMAIGFAATLCHAQTTEVPMPPGQIVKVPLKGAGTFGSALDLSTEVFKPAGPGPFPVLVYAHGRSGTQQERSALAEVVPRQFLGFWVARGFAVVAPARPGYGQTGGPDRESPGHSWDGKGNCSGVPNVERVAATAAPAILAAVAWSREQPWANSSKIVVAGNSVGGLVTAALAATNPPGVVAIINFAGGIAGNPDQASGRSCAPREGARRILVVRKDRPHAEPVAVRPERQILGPRRTQAVARRLRCQRQCGRIRADVPCAERRWP